MSLRYEELNARFGRALRGVGSDVNGGVVFDELVARYGEPRRYYHTLAHIDACLVWLDWFSASAERADEVELALWFHDAVYDPCRVDNERRSAQLASARLRALDVSPPVVDRVVHHILATEHHVAVCSDTALVVDVDLTILGAAPAEFARFEAQIRQEYVHVSEPLYRAGRARVLQSFLSRSLIYEVPAIREVLEGRARENIQRRVAQLMHGELHA